MAKKRSLDFKGLLLAHVEKLACLVIAVCFVFLLWAAFSQPGVEPGLEPDDISALAKRAMIVINQTTWEDFSDKPQMRNFAQESGWYDVPTAPYLLGVSWDPDVFPKQQLRDDPKYYPIQELEAHFDQGPLVLLNAERVRAIFKTADKPMPPQVEEELKHARQPLGKFQPVVAEDPNKVGEGAPTGPVKINLPGEAVDAEEVSEGRRWVMITGLLPWQEQIDAYIDKFRNAAGYDQKHDLPYYFGYEVERADVTGGIEPVWEPYDKVFPLTLYYDTIRWSQNKRTEVIAKQNRDAIFTWPLPPRVLELWGSRDKHSKIPLEAAATEKEEPAVAPMPAADPLGGLAEAMDESEPKPKPKEDTTPEIDYKMLRYFDFKVAPGHAYRYRFRVALRDPNYVREGEGSSKVLHRVELKLLEESVVNRFNEKRAALEKEGLTPDKVDLYMPVIYTEWSDPSPAVKVPPDVYVLALKAEQPPEGRYNVEPWASLLVTKYDEVLGLEVGGETRLQRGNVANFTADGIRIINVDHSTLETRKVPFATNNMLLDIRGGETLEEIGVTVPTELLLIDFERGGRLVVADGVDDAESVRAFRQRKTKIEELIPKLEENVRGPVTGPRGDEIIKPR